MTSLARWCLRRRFTVVVLWLAALVGSIAAATLAGSSYSDDYSVPGTESARATALLQKAFPGQSGDDTIVWHTEHGTVRAADVEQRMKTTLHEVAALPGVAHVDSPYASSGASGLVSKDRHTAYASLTFDSTAGGPGKAEVQKVVDTARKAADGNLSVALGGSTIGTTEGASGHLSEIIGVVVAAVVLFVVFGSLAASVLPIATALVGVGTASMGTTLLGHVMNVAGFAPMLGTLIGLGVGIDYALFIVTRHRKGLRQGLPVAVAAERAVATTGRAVVFAGGTVCVALLGMLILRLSFLNGVAIAASLTVVLTVAASVTLLPALLGIIGPPAPSAAGNAAASPSGSPARRAPPVWPPAGPPSSNATPSCWAPSRLPSCWSWRCPPSPSTWAPPTRATTPRRAPPGRPTTCSPAASAPGSTAP
ncbi:hypothetical protein GCM10020000_23950 [Streptomyces olivoverticillatus]